jgi:hypothetical protein
VVPGHGSLGFRGGGVERLTGITNTLRRQITKPGQMLEAIT